MERSKKMTTTNLPFSPDDTAKPEFIHPMLDDLGFTDEEEREATVGFCETTISSFEGKWPTIGELQILAAAFADGYGCGKKAKVG
jgi:hypothetical protein